MNPSSPFSPIGLLITGGTLDKDYNAISGSLDFSQTHLMTLLNQANVSLSIQSEVLMLKDSLEMTLQDRQTILTACLASPCQRLVITHGTDTLTDTAAFLLDSALPQSKTVVLTGAMRPFQLGQSDAAFNLGSALMAAQLTNNGIYIAMNGELFPATLTQKNRQQGVFEWLT